MKKILTSIMAPILTAACVIPTFSAGAIFRPADSDTAKNLIANGYVEVTKPDDPDAMESVMFQNGDYATYQKGCDYAQIVPYSYNNVWLSVASGNEKVQPIYEKYAEKLSFDVAENGGSKFTFYDKDGTEGDKSQLVTEMIKEMNAAGVVFDAANYSPMEGELVRYEYNANLILSGVSDEQLEAVKKTYHDYYYTEYPIFDQVITLITGEDYVIQAERNDYFEPVEGENGTYKVWLPLEFADKAAQLLQETYSDISVERKDEIMRDLREDVTTVDCQSGSIDFLDISDGTASGDVNLDGKIDLTDTILVKKYEAGAVTLAEAQKANADLDGNGTVDSNDAVQLLRFLLRLEESIG